MDVNEQFKYIHQPLKDINFRKIVKHFYAFVKKPQYMLHFKALIIPAFRQRHVYSVDVYSAQLLSKHLP